MKYLKRNNKIKTLQHIRHKMIGPNINTILIVKTRFRCTINTIMYISKPSQYSNMLLLYIQRKKNSIHDHDVKYMLRFGILYEAEANTYTHSQIFNNFVFFFFFNLRETAHGHSSMFIYLIASFCD